MTCHAGGLSIDINNIRGNCKSVGLTDGKADALVRRILCLVFGGRQRPPCHGLSFMDQSSLLQLAQKTCFYLEIYPPACGRRKGGAFEECLSLHPIRRSEFSIEVLNESSVINQAYLRQLQNRPPTRRRAGDMQKSQAQAETGLVCHALPASIFRAISASKSR